MEKIYEIVASPIWWITVVIAGIGINLVSSYLRDLLDVRISRVSSWWRKRSENKLKEDADYIQKLMADERFYALHSMRYTKLRTWAIIWMLVGMMGFLSSVILIGHGGEVFLMAIGSISFFRGFQHLMMSNKYFYYAEEAVDPENT